jgi:hypothetical protein
MPGKLIVCPTPIGNLEDITLRTRRALYEADVIACEDTRRTGLLLERLEIQALRLASYHEGNEAERSRTRGPPGSRIRDTVWCGPASTAISTSRSCRARRR